MTLKETCARSVSMSNHQTGNLCNSLIVGPTTTSASETEATGQHGGLLLLEVPWENMAVYKLQSRREKEHITFTKLLLINNLVSNKMQYTCNKYSRRRE